jgi:hypothetical protein
MACLQVGQRAFQQMPGGGGTDGQVLELGLDVQHLGQRQALPAATCLNHQVFLIQIRPQALSQLTVSLYFL